MQAPNMDVEESIDFPGEAFLAFANEHGLDARLFCIFAGCEGIYDPKKALEAFNACNAGTAKNLASWAKNFAGISGLLRDIPDSIRHYFDYAAWAQDAVQKGDIWIIDLYNEIAVFFALPTSLKKRQGDGCIKQRTCP